MSKVDIFINLRQWGFCNNNIHLPLLYQAFNSWIADFAIVIIVIVCSNKVTMDKIPQVIWISSWWACEINPGHPFFSLAFNFSSSFPLSIQGEYTPNNGWNWTTREWNTSKLRPVKVMRVWSMLEEDKLVNLQSDDLAMKHKECDLITYISGILKVICKTIVLPRSYFFILFLAFM